MPRKTKKPTRRGNKEGSIYQRSDGKWCGQVLAGYNALGKPIRKTFYGSTREEVSQKVTEGAYQAFSGNMPATVAAAVTVEKLITDYLWTFKKPAVSDVTFDWYLGIVRKHVIPELGTLPARDVTTYHIQRLLNVMNGKRLSQRHIKGARDILNQMFSQAFEMDLVARNTVTGAKVPKPSRLQSAKKPKAIPPADRKKILAAAETDIRMKTALTVLMFTGVRVGEFLALTWGNVDFKQGSITIDRAITRACEYNADGSLKQREMRPRPNAATAPSRCLPSCWTF